MDDEHSPCMQAPQFPRGAKQSKLLAFTTRPVLSSLWPPVRTIQLRRSGEIWRRQDVASLAAIDSSRVVIICSDGSVITTSNSARRLYGYSVSRLEKNNRRQGAYDDSAPVVVTGADVTGGLSLARALRSLGVPLYGLASDPSAPCCRSSAWTEVRPVSDDSEDGWMDALLKLSTHHDKQVLFVTQDTVVDYISRNREVLKNHYHFVLPDQPTLQMLADKSAFAEWAQANHFPVPLTRVVTSPAELRMVLNDLTFPVVLKPFMRDQKWYKNSGRNKAYRLNSPENIRNIRFPLFDVSDRYVVQEWIEGCDSDVHFCLMYRDRTGRELGYQTGRKLLQWPVDTGSTAICATTDDRALHRLTQELFDCAGLVGLASLEVKRDRRDGKYYITEPTVGRHDLQSNVATAAGVNLAQLAYRDAYGVFDHAEASHSRNAIWLNESSVPPAVIIAALGLRLNLVELGRVLLRCRAAMFAYSEIGDMRPLVLSLVGNLRTVAGLLIARLRAAARIFLESRTINHPNALL
jgi:D-aspartate ligase